MPSTTCALQIIRRYCIWRKIEDSYVSSNKPTERKELASKRLINEVRSSVLFIKDEERPASKVQKYYLEPSYKIRDTISIIPSVDDWKYNRFEKNKECFPVKRRDLPEK